MNATYKPQKNLAQLRKTPLEYTSFSGRHGSLIWVNRFTNSQQGITQSIYAPMSLLWDDSIHVFGDGRLLHQRGNELRQARFFNVPGRMFTTDLPAHLVSVQRCVWGGALTLLSNSNLPSKLPESHLSVLPDEVFKQWKDTCEILPAGDHRNEWRILAAAVSPIEIQRLEITPITQHEQEKNELHKTTRSYPLSGVERHSQG